MVDRTTARDELSALVKTALAGETALEWRYDDQPGDAPDAPATWVRLSIRHTASPQRTLGPLGTGQRRYDTLGLVFVQLFTPMGDGLLEADRISMVLVTALRGAVTTSGVKIKSVTAREIGADGAWQQTNITAEFEYHETA
jgi:hypothetical protein